MTTDFQTVHQGYPWNPTICYGMEVVLLGSITKVILEPPLILLRQWFRMLSYLAHLRAKGFVIQRT